MFHLFIFFQQISYYEVFPNYEIIIFATDVKHIIRITDFKKNQVTLAEIIKMLDEYTYDSGEFWHGEA